MAKQKSTGFTSRILFSSVFLSSLFLVSCSSSSVVRIPLVANNLPSNRIGIVSKSKPVFLGGYLDRLLKTDCDRNFQQSFRSISLDEMLIDKFKLLFTNRGYDLIHIGQEISNSNENTFKIDEKILVDIGKQNNMDIVLYLSTVLSVHETQRENAYSQYAVGPIALSLDAIIVNVETGKIIYHQSINTFSLDNNLLKEHKDYRELYVYYDMSSCEADKKSLHNALNIQADYIVSQIGANIPNKQQ